MSNDDISALRKVLIRNVEFVDDGATADLMDTSRLLVKAIRLNGPGPLARQKLLDAGITTADLEAAMTSEQSRIYQPDISCATPEQKYLSELYRARQNIKVKKFVEMWQCLYRFLANDEQQLCMSVKVGDGGDLNIYGLKEVNEAYHVPTLILDATYEHKIYKLIFPTIEEKLNIEVQKPFQKITQVVDTSDAMSNFKIAEKASEDTCKKRWERIKKRLEFIWAVALRYEGLGKNGEDVLVVGPKFLLDSFNELGGLPKNVSYAHHGALVGQNAWQGVGALIIISRLQLGVDDLEETAELLAGRDIRRIVAGDSGKWYPRKPYHIRKSNGKSCEVQNSYHPDLVANAYRDMMTRGGLLQAIGRARGCNRDKTTPLDILICTNEVLPITVGDTVRLCDLLLDRFDRMILDGAICFSAQDMALSYPNLFKSKDSAKGAIYHLKNNWAQIAIINIIMAKLTQLNPLEGEPLLTHVVRYRTGQRGQWKVLMINKIKYPNPEKYLYEKLSKAVLLEQNSIKSIEEFIADIS